MNVIYKTCFLIIFYFIFISCNEKKEVVENTKISFEKIKYDFGEIPAKKNISIVFRFLNSGNKPLIIKNVETSCGCTVPKWEKEKIMQNEVSEIEVYIDPTTRGKFYSSVVVHYNGDDSPQKLMIEGEVEYLSLLE